MKSKRKLDEPNSSSNKTLKYSSKFAEVPFKHIANLSTEYMSKVITQEEAVRSA